MANTILANPEDLKNKSNQIRELKEQHLDAMNRITNIVMTIGEVWRGDAQDAFVAKFQGMQNVYKSFEEALEEFAEQMEKFANEIREKDLSGKSLIDSIN